MEQVVSGGKGAHQGGPSTSRFIEDVAQVKQLLASRHRHHLISEELSFLYGTAQIIIARNLALGKVCQRF